MAIGTSPCTTQPGNFVFLSSHISYFIDGSSWENACVVNEVESLFQTYFNKSFPQGNSEQSSALLVQVAVRSLKIPVFLRDGGPLTTLRKPGVLWENNIEQGEGSAACES